MRIPFDLIAAVICVEAVRGLLERRYAGLSYTQVAAAAEAHATTGEALAALAAFWLVYGLLHELLVRVTEWRTRWGRRPLGLEPSPLLLARRHPLARYGRAIWVIQVLAVAGYALFLWQYQWPLKTAAWPEWCRLDRVLSRGTCNALRDSQLIGGLLDLGPFVVALVIGWVPKRRLAARGAPLGTWISFEARLALLPFFLWLALYLTLDLATWLLPRDQLRVLQQHPWAAALSGVAALVFLSVVLMPCLVVWLWQCRPLPDGALKQRLLVLLARSGVRARAILLWGPGGSGLANACVLGPWAPLRYILISPGLLHALDAGECEAVVAHEISHVRYGHLSLLVSLVVALAALAELVLRLMQQYGFEDPLAQAAVLLLLMGGYLRLFFGAISRRCEREADLASVELVGSPAPLVSALERISVLSGGIRDLYSWHHDSIGRRVQWLLTVGADPGAIQALHARQKRLRLALVALAGLAVAALVAVAWLDTPAAG